MNKQIIEKTQVLMYHFRMVQFIKKFAILCLLAFTFTSCNKSEIKKAHMHPSAKSYQKDQATMKLLLEKENLAKETKYAIINKLATNMLAVKDYPSLMLFLTQYVEKNPDDTYNAYYLLMTAYAYLENNAEPIAEYYFEKILNNYNDLLVHGKSVHLICLKELIRISKNSTNKIIYFNQLINRFPDDINTTEMFYRLALEYEKQGEWNLAIKTYTTYLEQDNAAAVQIPGYPNAYANTKQLIDFSNSSKDWTFDTLDELVKAIQKGIATYNYKNLDKYKSKVNFFAMSWHQEETDVNAQENFSMRSFMRGNKIRYSPNLDSTSSPTEAFLRTTGWSTYINVWYLYFRKVNFPADPEIHGRWEWAGIYFGEKL